MLYFVLTKILLYGVSETQLDVFAGFRAILAGASGSVMHLGIGPIVTGSIIMQLFTGAKIINLDLTKKEDKAIYQGSQKIIVMVMILVEAIPQVFGFLQPDDRLISKVGGGWADTIIVAQLSFGALVVFLMDELISKWGIGSGISMFIAAGVSEQIFTGTFSWFPVNEDQIVAGEGNVAANPPAGTIPKLIATFAGWPSWLPGPEYAPRPIGSIVYQGGFEDLFLGSQFFPNSIAALVGTILILFFVVYAESTRIE